MDRDGTINREVDYLSDPADFEFLPGAIEALRALQAAGFALVVVTNQSGIARGLFDEDTLHRIHGRMTDELSKEGVEIDWIGYCPHHHGLESPLPELASFQADCSCRKPRPGLLLLAAADLGIDLARSFCVGDSLRDLEAGEELHVPGLLVRTGKGAAQEAIARAEGRDVRVVDDLGAAARYILGL
ncbi:D-glycero-beta-D-manno-heptose-1,7-bisphosphate 7-phosphatase [Planctomycetes bacterium Poly30]|uniref:D,D-heptose 1,7-bisphosphate phosphatase n=1 Tax=Saltatorellus ferox TaxID=2528018 RepID=A0A518EU18_9BACT|nr:D-glycero-beta-D-manno-heptose-1,7-bisphosphate 7-phosphatase [Planctomycetes bacterium Poly30]